MFLLHIFYKPEFDLSLLSQDFIIDLAENASNAVIDEWFTQILLEQHFFRWR